LDDCCLVYGLGFCLVDGLCGGVGCWGGFDWGGDYVWVGFCLFYWLLVDGDYGVVDVVGCLVGLVFGDDFVDF